MRQAQPDVVYDLRKTHGGQITEKTSRIDGLYVYDRIHEILDNPDEWAELASAFLNEMAYNIKVDTGLTPGELKGRLNDSAPNVE